MLSLLFRFTFGGDAALTPPRGLQLGFDVDIEPALWWQRKPKALEPAVAKARLRKVAEVIVEKAQQHADKRVPEPQRRADVKEAVSTLVQEMPGFDAKAFYKEAYRRAVTALIAQQLREQDERKAAAAAADKARRLRDDEDIALLMALI